MTTTSNASSSLSGGARGSGTVLLEVEGVTHLYRQGTNEHLAISNMTFTVYAGEFVAIVGPSGAGKTTLLRILSGLLPPARGTITLDGKRVVGVPDRLAMVFQDYSRSLLPWLTVAHNVEFPLRYGKVRKRAERARRVSDALAQVGLTGHEHRYPWQLSGGMQQRVAIARALAYEPRLLVMDEPFASLDAQTRAELEDLVISLNRRLKVTTIFVTHDIDESVYLADRVVALSKAPATLTADIDVRLPEPRDQIATRENEDYIALRGQVARLIRDGGVLEEGSDA